ncbi:hypothetical protein SERLA73DRAFT_185044 [Serpula lacrymans var. lacrymans S7.3]|uniref:Uncharacterized protein n=2 Tax=Serpula lacrymans var. lacrymans TaxID=341189 RepID=F8Q3Z0_SERL3|nr:uncharacterized protein SERLADRAFT_473272 [Serpula lacrymans var. lacrymans S7.9]EGN96846.1 hypothetical protein SERLA73DRAFT_185044 [Serpula lacrymans var. lacrymans S7.3]EGO22447.1 hypothetical protein SERLADRAFT_473272 [Serpula lacrymans var. lacrymans S7.9]
MDTVITPLKGGFAIKSNDGRYLKVIGEGLAFRDQIYDSSAKFTTERTSNQQNVLKGNNGKYVRIYETNKFDIKCDAKDQRDALSVGSLFLADSFVNFTITNQASLGGRTVFMSSEVGSVSYSPSIRAKDFEDVSCRFTVSYVLS